MGWWWPAAGLWKVVAEQWKMPGFLASGGEEFNLGPETRLDHSELLCNRVLLKYKRTREGFWHRHQRGQKEYPLVSVSNGVIYLLISYYDESKTCLKFVKILPDSLHNLHFRITKLEFVIPHSHNMHSKISGLVIRFSGRRNCPLAGYIVLV